MRQKYIIPNPEHVLANQVRLASLYHSKGLPLKYDFKPRYLEAVAMIDGTAPITLESSPLGRLRHDLTSVPGDGV